MARTKRRSKLRPKRTSAGRTPRAFRHPELWGLGIVALGAFLASVVYVGWNGGYVGAALADGLDAVVGKATWALPARAEFLDALQRAVELVERADGEVLVFDAVPRGDVMSARLEALFNEEREAEWAEFLAECTKLLAVSNLIAAS